MSDLPLRADLAGLDLIAGGPLLQIQVAIAARLALAFPPRQFTHDVVPARLTQAIWEQLTRRCPFIGYTWMGWKPSARNGRLFRGDIQFGVYLMTRNALPAKVLGGDRSAPGLYHMVQIALGCLHGHTIAAPDGTEQGTIEIDQVSNLYSEEWGRDDAALAGITGVVPGVALADATDPSAARQLDDFLRLGVTWSFGDATSAYVDTVRGA